MFPPSLSPAMGGGIPATLPPANIPSDYARPSGGSLDKYARFNPDILYESSFDHDSTPRAPTKINDLCNAISRSSSTVSMEQAGDDTHFMTRVSSLPIISSLSKAYAQTKESSGLLKYGAGVVESGAISVMKRVGTSGLVNWKGVDNFACKQWDRLEGWRWNSQKEGDQHQDLPPIPMESPPPHLRRVHHNHELDMPQDYHQDFHRRKEEDLPSYHHAFVDQKHPEENHYTHQQYPQRYHSYCTDPAPTYEKQPILRRRTTRECHDQDEDVADYSYQHAPSMDIPPPPYKSFPIPTPHPARSHYDHPESPMDPPPSFSPHPLYTREYDVPTHDHQHTSPGNAQAAPQRGLYDDMWRSYPTPSPSSTQHPPFAGSPSSFPSSGTGLFQEQASQSPVPPVQRDEQMHSEGKSTWQQIVAGAGAAAGATSAVLSDQAERSLKYCFHWLTIAIETINEQVALLRTFLTTLSTRRQITASDNTLVHVKMEVVGAIRKAVDILGKHAGAFLNGDARERVRQYILRLPARWATLVAKDTDDRTPSSEAHKILTLAQESLTMLSSIRQIFMQSLETAHTWLDRLPFLNSWGRRGDERMVKEKPEHVDKMDVMEED